jgi:ribokinase
VVVGSVNMDLVVRVASLPRSGETVTGRELLEIPGGKGANQAVAAARLGADSALLGRVGDDAFGAGLRRALEQAGVDTEAVRTTPGSRSGMAFIGVDDRGQNSIIILPGANVEVTPDDVRRAETMLAAADAILLQLEIPAETVAEAIRLGKRLGVRTVLDTAPIPEGDLPEDLWTADVVSPNQTEAETLTGIPVRGPEDAARAAACLRERGASLVVVKLGAQGAFVLGDGVAAAVPARRVMPVDTTAAGDAFTAALTLALVEGRDPVAATQFGCAAGTLATLTAGAQPAMPRRQAVDDFLAQPRGQTP